MSNNAVPELVKKRIEIAKLFYPLERKLQRRFAKRLISGFNETADYLSEFAKEIGFIQKIDEENFIVWNNNNKSQIECLFCYIEDATKLALFTELFEKIKKHLPIFTYAFVNQEKDGDGVFDIFRFSKFSYLEHCNRVKYP